MEVNKTVAVSVAVFCFLLCLLTLGQFIPFLSSHTSLRYFFSDNSDHFKNASDESNQDSVIFPMVKNMALLVIFVFQHSLQARKEVKDFLTFRGLNVLERLFYNIGSCLALQIIMYFWQSVPVLTVWEVSTHDHKTLWWIFTSIHVVAWLIIYGGCFVMDLPELLGAKQVYNYAFNWPTPLILKSDGLKRFYSHMRHPYFSAFIVILFVHPVMQIDRLCLAYALTFYMLKCFKIDDIDYAYQRRELQRKYRDLNLRS